MVVHLDSQSHVLWSDEAVGNTLISWAGSTLSLLMGFLTALDNWEKEIGANFTFI